MHESKGCTKDQYWQCAWLTAVPALLNSILFYSILFYSILFYSILFYSILSEVVAYFALQGNSVIALILFITVLLSNLNCNLRV